MSADRTPEAVPECPVCGEPMNDDYIAEHLSLWHRGTETAPVIGYIYLGPGAGHGTISDRPLPLNRYDWYCLGPPLSSDPADRQIGELSRDDGDDDWRWANGGQNPRRVLGLDNQ